MISRFAQKINLKKHVQASHMSENGHPCPHCNMKFRARDDVANHILKQHVGQALANISQRSQPSNLPPATGLQQDERSDALAEVHISLKGKNHM